MLISDPGDGRTEVRILDFGLAKLTQAIVADSQNPTAAAPLTSPGMALGTFGYMSPEQLMGGEVDDLCCSDQPRVFRAPNRFQARV
ncbi:MAG: hypothetical protein M3539_00165 [Acidobacteriota bacterium]|nr:hypothetical protein [Acidobacteriota bacterium]